MKNTFGKLAIGINDNWEVFAGFGVSKSDYREKLSWMDGGDLKQDLMITHEK